VPTIGLPGAAKATAWRPFVASFVRRLGELGWVEGRTVAIEYRWADARNERFAEIAAEFVRRKVATIVTSGTAVAAAKQETSTIPIVFALAVDPIGIQSWPMWPIAKSCWRYVRRLPTRLASPSFYLKSGARMI